MLIPLHIFSSFFVENFTIQQLISLNMQIASADVIGVGDRILGVLIRRLPLAQFVIFFVSKQLKKEERRNQGLKADQLAAMTQCSQYATVALDLSEFPSSN